MLAIRKLYGLSQKSMSRKLGLSANVWGNSEANSTVPSGDTLIKIADLGFNPTWILTGQGTMRLDEAQGSEAGAEVAEGAVDAQLFGRIVDLVTREAKAAAVMLPPLELGTIAGKRYAELIAASNNPDERRAMLKLVAVQLRAELRAPVTPAGTTSPRKGSA